MNCSLLRITVALTLVACVAHAAPILSTSGYNFDSSDVASGDTSCDSSLGNCDQTVSSGNVALGSTVNAVPITQVTPVTHYQSFVQAFAPIVQSACDDTSDLDDSDFMNTSPMSGGNDFYSGLGSCILDNNDMNGFYQGTGSDNIDTSLSPPNRRRDLSDASNTPSSTANVQYPDSTDISTDPSNSSDSSWDPSDMSSICSQNAQAQGCDTWIPAQNVNLGSTVSMVPSTAVSPSTYYQPQVQYLQSDIQASPAQSSSLPQQNVNLGSNVAIQPLTQVLPQTVYQPEVHQMATSVQASDVGDQSLPQSSVQLGSSVQITPTVSVTPLTQFQNTVQSLPFTIDVEPCDASDTSDYGNSVSPFTSGWSSPLSSSSSYLNPSIGSFSGSAVLPVAYPGVSSLPMSSRFGSSLGSVGPDNCQ
ncbi:hypothetical protein EMPS_07576 [Entomortierella parvispora]|uniref:Uncharacterized protein n=1 Tax=Entomortierella parvispora TaxID=205924 RepID=A0A9P3LYK5_9FUNG|nr:hypothetical protein EMPS_07576 [Entomortierella parvispora]